MKRTVTLSVLGLAGMLAAPASVGMTRVTAQQPACLHGPQEDANQVARKKSALGFTRQVNTLQARAMGTTGSYLAADQLQLALPLPEGFEFRLAAAPKAYAFAVQDNTDPCRFAYFSDQVGLIFHGEVIR